MGSAGAAKARGETRSDGRFFRVPDLSGQRSATAAKANPVGKPTLIYLCVLRSLRLNGSGLLEARLQLPPAFHRLQHRDFIGVFDIAAGWDAGGDARNLESGTAKLA